MSEHTTGSAGGGTGGNWHDVGGAAELAISPLRQVTIGRTKIALTHKNGEFAAISGVCNHVGGPLGEGRLDGDYIVCPWHNWKFHWKSGKGEPGYEDDAVPAYAVRVENGRVLVCDEPTTKRSKKPHEPHPLTKLTVRGQPGGPGLDEPLRVVGISTTNMDLGHPRYSTSDDLLGSALARAREDEQHHRTRERQRIPRVQEHRAEGEARECARAPIVAPQPGDHGRGSQAEREQRRELRAPAWIPGGVGAHQRDREAERGAGHLHRHAGDLRELHQQTSLHPLDRRDISATLSTMVFHRPRAIILRILLYCN